MYRRFNDERKSIQLFCHDGGNFYSLVIKVNAKKVKDEQVWPVMRKDLEEMMGELDNEPKT